MSPRTVRLTPTYTVALVALTSALAAPASAAPPASVWRAVPEGTIEVTQLVIARQVVDRRPDVVGQQIPLDGERVYGFARVLNKGPARELLMVWRRDGQVVHRYRLAVGRSPAWRTWSCLRATRANSGHWTVSLEDAAGASLADEQLAIGVN